MFCLDHSPQEKDEELEMKINVEMSLDEWKALQEASRPKAEFNIRKAEDKIPTKAKVIHQSRQQEVRNLIMGRSEVILVSSFKAWLAF